MDLVGCVLHAVLGGVTGFLQADALVAGETETDTKAKAKGPLLVVYPIVIGVSGSLLVLGVRLLPYDTHPKAGIALHVVMAGCFQMFSIIYCFATVTLATDLFGVEATVTVIRKAFAYISAAGLGLSFLFGGYVMGKAAPLTQHASSSTSIANNHNNNATKREAEAGAMLLATDSDAGAATDDISGESAIRASSGNLTPKQVWAIRCWMAALGAVQLSIGIVRRKSVEFKDVVSYTTVANKKKFLLDDELFVPFYSVEEKTKLRHQLKAEIRAVKASPNPARTHPTRNFFRRGVEHYFLPQEGRQARLASQHIDAVLGEQHVQFCERGAIHDYSAIAIVSIEAGRNAWLDALAGGGGDETEAILIRQEDEEATAGTGMKQGDGVRVHRLKLNEPILEGRRRASDEGALCA